VIVRKKEDIAKFRAFGCSAYVCLNEEQRGKGRYIPRAVEAINICLATNHNIRGYNLYIPATQKFMISNQVRFDERKFP
jgi:hypothetical protein